MEKKKVTIEDVARSLGIAKSTVSKALSDATDISPEMREKVLRCASALGYQVRRRQPAQNGCVAVFVAGIEYESVDLFGHEVLLGFQSEASSARIGMQVVPVAEEENFDERYCELSGQSGFLGSFFLGFRPARSFAKTFERIGRPAVLLDKDYDSVLTAHIGTDNTIGMSEAVAHLAALGHHRIGFLGGERELSITMERKEAFDAALRQYGMDLDAPVAFAGFHRDYDPALVLQLVDEGATALICCSDLIALAAMKKLSAAGISVPQQVSVIGYDGIPLAGYATPGLTTIAQNSLQMGKIALRMLRDLSDGVQISRVLLRPKLIVRESTAAVSTAGEME